MVLIKVERLHVASINIHFQNLHKPDKAENGYVNGND